MKREYDFSKMIIVSKGRYAPHRRVGKNVVLLAPDVIEAFPSDESVNEALRLVIQISKIPSKRGSRAVDKTKSKQRTIVSTMKAKGS
jgi:hypothetical protein